MKLSEIKGEKAIDVLADLIDPICEIASDKELMQNISKDKAIAQMIKPLLKNHRDSVINIMAVLDGAEDIKAYAATLNIFTLPARLLDILNDPELISLFTLQNQNTAVISFGSASQKD